MANIASAKDLATRSNISVSSASLCIGVVRVASISLNFSNTPLSDIFKNVWNTKSPMLDNCCIGVPARPAVRPTMFNFSMRSAICLVRSSIVAPLSSPRMELISRDAPRFNEIALPSAMYSLIAPIAALTPVPYELRICGLTAARSEA